MELKKGTRVAKRIIRSQSGGFLLVGFVESKPSHASLPYLAGDKKNGHTIRAPPKFVCAVNNQHNRIVDFKAIQTCL